MHESLVAALVRELDEECGIRIERPELWRVVDHDYGDRLVRLHLFLVVSWHGEPQSRQGLVWRWASVDELRQLDWPAANRQFIPYLDQLAD